MSGPNAPARLERSMLSVPGASAKMIEKAVASAADAVMLDLEDAVPAAGKPAARPIVAHALRSLDWGGKIRLFRINALDTVWAYRDLIEVVEAAGPSIDAIMVPKVGRPEDIAFVDILLTQIEGALGLNRRIGIEAQIESASGLLNAERIAFASPRLEALVFGPGDYAASMRMPLDAIGALDEWDEAYPGHRWHYAMQRIVAAARAAGLRAQDGPLADYKDLDGLRRVARIARAIGFDGKWCIHLAQIAVVNEVFSPTPRELVWARRVVDAYEAAGREGRGVVTLDGTMIDMASVRMAQAALDRERR